MQLVLNMTFFHTSVEEGFGFMFATSSSEGQLWTFLLMGYLLAAEKAVASTKKSAGVDPCMN